MAIDDVARARAAIVLGLMVDDAGPIGGDLETHAKLVVGRALDRAFPSSKDYGLLSITWPAGLALLRLPR